MDLGRYLVSPPFTSPAAADELKGFFDSGSLSWAYGSQPLKAIVWGTNQLRSSANLTCFHNLSHEIHVFHATLPLVAVKSCQCPL